MKLCVIDGCDRKHMGRGFCASHYMRWKRHGTAQTDIPFANEKVDLVTRFKRKMSAPDCDGCQSWIGASNRYGRFTIGSKKDGTKTAALAHRLSYELFVGPIPDGMYVCHRCDNTICVNPAHLFLGTQMDNMQDMISKGRDNKRSSPI